MTLYSITTHTPLGKFSMIFDRDQKGEDVVIASGFSGAKQLEKRLLVRSHDTQVIPLDEMHPYIDHITAYFSGDRHALRGVKTKQSGSVFEEKVWKALTRTRWGAQLSYKDLAEKVGSPSAYRAVGSACGANKLVLIVPCHRVLRSDGDVGGYVYGKHAKKFLLGHERK
jgi:O-6-methylguanine DNA methyltransferase